VPIEQVRTQALPLLAVAEGATTPNPGGNGWAWSSTLAKPVYWTGTQWTAGAAAADPWTYVKLSSDFVTSSATAVDVTGLGFTPAANKSYVFEAQLLTRTAATAAGVRPGIAWPAGTITDAVVEVRQSTSATAQVLAFGNGGAAVQALGTALPNTTQSWPAKIAGTLITAASPSGNLQVIVASETAGTNVTIKAGSWLRYREI
jgi:hypothetical protein